MGAEKHSCVTKYVFITGRKVQNITSADLLSSWLRKQLLKPLILSASSKARLPGDRMDSLVPGELVVVLELFAALVTTEVHLDLVDPGLVVVQTACTEEHLTAQVASDILLPLRFLLSVSFPKPSFRFVTVTLGFNFSFQFVVFIFVVLNSIILFSSGKVFCFVFWMGVCV